MSHRKFKEVVVQVRWDFDGRTLEQVVEAAERLRNQYGETAFVRMSVDNTQPHCGGEPLMEVVYSELETPEEADARVEFEAGRTPWEIESDRAEAARAAAGV